MGVSSQVLSVSQKQGPLRSTKPRSNCAQRLIWGFKGTKRYTCGASSVSQPDSMARTSRISYLQDGGQCSTELCWAAWLFKSSAMRCRLAEVPPQPAVTPLQHWQHCPAHKTGSFLPGLTSRCHSAPRSRSKPTAGGSGRAPRSGGCAAWLRRRPLLRSALSGTPRHQSPVGLRAGRTSSSRVETQQVDKMGRQERR
jgi:hypothetical protein